MSADSEATIVLTEGSTLAEFFKETKLPVVIAKAFLAALGAEEDTPLDDVAAIPMETVTPSFSEYQDDDKKKLSPLQIGRLHKAFKAIVSIVTPMPTPVPIAPLVATPEGSVSNGKRKISQVLDQTDESVFDKLTAEERAVMRERHRLAVGDAPPEAERPSSDQLGALKHKLSTGDAPYVDLSIWCPFGKPGSKIRKFDAQVWVDNELRTKAIHGPSGYDAWLACWKVFRAAMLMNEAASPAVLDRYADGIRDLSMLYKGHWGVIFLADELNRFSEGSLIRPLRQ